MKQHIALGDIKLLQHTESQINPRSISEQSLCGKYMAPLALEPQIKALNPFQIPASQKHPEPQSTLLERGSALI